MKKLTTVALTLVLAALVAPLAFGQGVTTVVGQTLPTALNPAASTTSQGGAVTNPSSNFIINITGGPIICFGGEIQTINSAQMTLAANTTNLLVYNCGTNPPLYAKQAVTGPGSNGTSQLNQPGNPTSLLYALPGVETSLATIVCGSTNCGNTSNGTITDNRTAGNFPILTDRFFFVPASQCGGAVTGTAGSGNATDIPALSGGVRVFRLSNTNAGASNNTFTCNFQLPSKLTSGYGATITDITLLVSTQTTQPTSVVTSTLKTFTAPAAVDPETASSATFVAAGGTITMSPTSAQFAAYSAVTAGQFYSLKAGLGTPVAVNTDLQEFVVTFQFNQSAAAAGVQETPGFYVHYTYNGF